MTYGGVLITASRGSGSGVLGAVFGSAVLLLIVMAAVELVFDPRLNAAIELVFHVALYGAVGVVSATALYWAGWWVNDIATSRAARREWAAHNAARRASHTARIAPAAGRALPAPDPVMVTAERVTQAVTRP